MSVQYLYEEQRLRTYLLDVISQIWAKSIASAEEALYNIFPDGIHLVFCKQFL